MASPWREHPSWAIVEQAEAALGEPLGAPRHRRTGRRARPHTRSAARGAPHVARRVGRARARSPKPRSRSPATRSARSPRSIAAGALPLDAGVRFAARRAELTQAAADAHPGRMAALLGATPEQADDACAAAPDACWVANDNAPGQVVIAGTPDGVAAGSARGQGARRDAGHAAQRRRRVPHAAHAPTPRAGLAARGSPPLAFADPLGPGGVEPRRAWPTPTPTAGATGSRPRLGAGPLALDHGHARRPRRHHVRRGRARLDARGARQARRPRRHRPQRRHPRQTSPRPWRSANPWRPC